MNALKKFFLKLFNKERYEEVVFEEKKDRLVEEVRVATGVQLNEEERARIDTENFQRIHELLVSNYWDETLEKEIERKARAVLHGLIEEEIIDRPKVYADVYGWAKGRQYTEQEDKEIMMQVLEDGVLARIWGRTPSAIQTRRQRLKNKG